MRVAAVLSVMAIMASPAAHARGDALKFEGVQEHCVQAGGIKFGANSRWKDCQVTKGRWFATLDFIDMYQAQYCLSDGGESCDRRALMVFSNRAYKPAAQLMLSRTDAGDAEYDDPLVVQTAYGDMLELTARTPAGHVEKTYHLWRSGKWTSVDARGWLREASKHLPKGMSVPAGAWPDIDSMSAQATLADDRVIKVNLGLAGNRFVVKKVDVVQKETSPSLALAQHEPR